MGLKRKAIERIIEQGNFDVIHYHNVSLVGGLDVLAVGRAVKLYTLHEYWLVCPTHILYKNNAFACDRPECFRCQLIYRRPPQLWRNQAWMKKMLGQVDRFLAGSEFTIELHRQRGVELNAEVLPLATFWPEPAKRDEHPAVAPAYFFFVGRLEKLKGLQDVIPLFARSPDLSLLIAGSGSYEKQLKALAGGSPNIHFLGALPHGELKPLYEQAIATIIPSMCYEICALVLGESWSCATLVITRDIGSLKEAVEQSGGGMCFRSTAELADQVLRLARDSDLRKRLSDLAYQTYLAERTPEGHMSRYLDIVSSIQSQRRGGTGSA